MSMLSLGFRMLLKGSRSVSKDIAERTGVGVVSKPTWSFADKIEELQADHGLSPEYVKELINGAKSEQMLRSVESYLVSNRNDLDWKTTDTLLEKVEKKIGDAKWQEHLNELKKQFLANHADHVTALLDHIQEMI